MSSEHSSQWLSVHIYYAEPWDALFLKGLHPFLELTYKAGGLDDFFFVRYFERGPHLRLRIRLKGDNMRELLVNQLQEHFTRFFENHPSKLRHPAYPEDWAEEDRWMETNQLVFEPYVPEIRRYLGQKTLGLAEQQFVLSARIVLQEIVNAGPVWGYDAAMGKALQLDMAMLAAIDWDDKTVALFLRMFMEQWMSYAAFMENVDLGAGTSNFIVAEVLAGFQEEYRDNQQEVFNSIWPMWSAIRSGAVEAEGDLAEWIDFHKYLLLKVRTTRAAGQTYMREQDSLPSKSIMDQLTDAQLQDMMYVADLMHMTHNRLGILNQDESQIAFFLLQCLNDGWQNQS